VKSGSTRDGNNDEAAEMSSFGDNLVTARNLVNRRRRTLDSACRTKASRHKAWPWSPWKCIIDGHVNTCVHVVAVIVTITKSYQWFHQLPLVKRCSNRKGGIHRTGSGGGPCCSKARMKEAAEQHCSKDQQANERLWRQGGKILPLKLL